MDQNDSNTSYDKYIDDKLVYSSISTFFEANYVLILFFNSLMKSLRKNQIQIVDILVYQAVRAYIRSLYPNP